MIVKMVSIRKVNLLFSLNFQLIIVNNPSADFHNKGHRRHPILTVIMKIQVVLDDSIFIIGGD
jgi:hypothetical protein